MVVGAVIVVNRSIVDILEITELQSSV